MVQTLSLTNFGGANLINGGRTQLVGQGEIAAGSSSLTVENTDNYVATGFIILGATGSSNAEMVQAARIPAEGQIVLSYPTLLPHAPNEDVYALFGDQLQVYRASNVDGSQPADITFSPLGGPITIDPNSTTTSFTDPAGGGAFWYKYTYCNSITGARTELPSSRAARGTFTVEYCTLGEIRQEAGFQNAVYVSDAQIDLKRQWACDKVHGRLNKFYEIPLQPPIPDTLRQIVISLAAGALRKAQYSAVSDSKMNGQSMIDDGMLALDELVIKEEELMTKDGKSLALEGGVGEAGGWPDGTSASADPTQGGSSRIFRMSDIQGQSPIGDGSHFYGNSYYGR